MIRKYTNKLLMGLALSVGVMSAPTLAMAAQTESPVACDEAGEPIPLVYGDHTTGCEVNGPTDLDNFRFDGVAGDDIWIIVQSTTPGLDPRLELRDPDGVVIEDTFCNGNDAFGNPIRCSFRRNHSLVLTGTYFLAISDQGANETGSYTLQLERVPPVAPPPGLPYNLPMNDAVDPATDMDFFVFEGNEGTEIRVTVLSQTPGFDPLLQIWGPDGAVIPGSSCNGNDAFGNPIICSFSVNTSLTLSGTYLLSLVDGGLDEIGNYEIDLQCLFGTCPGIPPTRPECDIEMSQPIYIDGETVIANMLRLANPTPDPLALELKIWIDVPGGAPGTVLNLGADGSFVLPAGFDTDLGPVTLFPVLPSLPLGTYEFSCRMLDPVTGRLLREDRNFFDVQ